MNLDVVALGELLVDFTCLGKNAQGYPLMEAHPGGAPANFLGALSKLGAKTALLGKVGSDSFGSLLLNSLKEAGIDTRGMVTDEEAFTTLAFVTLDERGEREFSFARKPGADTCLKFEELDLSLIEKARVFHFGSLSLSHEPARSATRKAVEFAKLRGKLISYDPNLRKPLWEDPDFAKKQLLWGLKQADVVKISHEEVKFLFDLEPLAGAGHILEHFGAKLVFVTCGAEGCYFQNPKGCGRVPALRNIQVQDTTGAGDIFGGSALWRLLQIGKEPEELEKAELLDVASFACTAASLSTTRSGGLSSVFSLEEMEAAASARQAFA